MSARLLEIYAVLGQQKAVRGAQDTSEATFSFIEGDTYRLRLNAQRPVSEPGSTQRYTPATFSEFTSFEAALGQVDAAPEGGKWKIKKTGGAFSAELNHNATPAEVKAAVEALAGIGTDKVTVTNGNASHIYIIRPVNPADDFTFETQSSLVPLCTARVRKGSDGSGSYTVVKLHKAYFAFADQWEFPMPPEVEVISERTGSTTKNATQLISIPVGAMGSFELQHAGFSTRTIPVDGITAAAVESALNELFSDGATAPRFRCFDAGSNAIQVECIGALAKQAVATLGIERYGQVPLPTPEADFALTELPMELFIATKDKLKLKLDIVGIDAEGREHTLVLKDAEILNSLIDRGSSATIGAVATRYVDVTTTVDPDAPIQVGFRSTTKITTGSGTEGVPGEYTDNFTHNLNIRFPYIIAFRLISVSPEKWQQVDDDEFTVETISLTQSKVQFTTIPPTTGNVGSIKLIALNPEAGVWTNDHRHDTDGIDGVGADSAKTLTEIITELRAAMPSGWPTVPGSALAAASVTADKLDLASLIAVLFANTEFLTKLRDLATDSTFVETLLESMATSTSLGEFVKAIASTIATDRTVAEEWLQMFRELPGLDVILRELLLKGLQDLSSLPAGVVFFAMPTFEFVYPPAQAMPAPSILSTAIEDVETTVAGEGVTTKTIGKATVAKSTAATAVRYALLSPSFTGATDAGTKTGILPETAPLGEVYAVVGTAKARTASTRRGRDWPADSLITFDNGHWFEVRVDDTVSYPVEMEREMHHAAVSQRMLDTIGTAFQMQWLLSAALEGDVRGYIDVVAEIRGATDAPELIFRHTVSLSRTAAFHQFAMRIHRDALNTAATSGVAVVSIAKADIVALQSITVLTGPDRDVVICLAEGSTVAALQARDPAQAFFTITETATHYTIVAQNSGEQRIAVTASVTPSGSTTVSDEGESPQKIVGTYSIYGAEFAFPTPLPGPVFDVRIRTERFRYEPSVPQPRGSMRLKSTATANIAKL